MSWEVVSCWIESHPGLASWVQAIGSIAAIAAAGFFPFIHERAKEKQTRRNTLTSLLHMANRLENLLVMEGNALGDEIGHEMWRTLNRTQELKLVSQLVDELPASMFIGFEMTYLSELRSCAAYAKKLAEDFDDNDWRTIRNHHDFDYKVQVQRTSLDAIQSLSCLITDERRSL